MSAQPVVSDALQKEEAVLLESDPYALQDYVNAGGRFSNERLSGGLSAAALIIIQARDYFISLGHDAGIFQTFRNGDGKLPAADALFRYQQSDVRFDEFFAIQYAKVFEVSDHPEYAANFVRSYLKAGGELGPEVKTQMIFQPNSRLRKAVLNVFEVMHVPLSDIGGMLDLDDKANLLEGKGIETKHGFLKMDRSSASEMFQVLDIRRPTYAEVVEFRATMPGGPKRPPQTVNHPLAHAFAFIHS